MKVKFTKLAALLLAGVALFATGCTDYEVDIQRNADAIASVKDQIAALQATIATLETAADHKADVDKLNKAITDLQSELNGKIAELTTEVGKKLDKSEFETAKKQLSDAIDAVAARVKAIEDANFQKQLDDLKADVATKATKAELEKAVEDLTKLINGEIAKLDTRITNLEAAVKKINEETIPAINTQISNLQTLKLDKSDFEAYKTATATTLELMQDAIDELGKTCATKEELKAEVDKIIALLEKDYATKAALEEALAKAMAAIDDVKGAIRSIVFVPENYVDGVEAIVINTLKYPTQTIEDDVFNTPEEVAVESEDSTLVSPKVIARYHIVPGVDKEYFDTTEVTFVVRPDDPFYVTRTRAKSENLVVTGKFVGVDEKEPDVVLIEVNVEGTAATDDYISVVALQLTNGGETYTSDYATIFSQKLDDLRIAKPAKEDYHYRRALEEVAGISALDAEAGIPDLEVYLEEVNVESCDTSLVYDKPLDLLTITEAHVTAEGEEKCQAIDAAKLNLDWKFELVNIEDWTVGAIDQITLDEEAKTVTATINAMDLTPVVRTYLVNDDEENAQIAYIKFYVAPQDFENDQDMGELEFSCEGDELVAETNVYEKFGMTKETFLRVYPEFKTTLEEEDDEAGDTAANEPETVGSEEVTFDPETGEITWTVDAAWIWNNGSVDEDAAPGTPVEKEVYFVNPNNGAVFTVTLKAKRAVIKSYRIKIDKYIKNYWNDDLTAAQYNVFTPDYGEKDSTKCVFHNNINAAFLTDDEGVIDLTGVGMEDIEVTDIKYFFCDDMAVDAEGEEKVTKIGEYDVIFSIEDGEGTRTDVNGVEFDVTGTNTILLAKLADDEEAEPVEIAYICNDADEKDVTPNVVVLVKDLDPNHLAKKLLNTDELYVLLGATGMICGDEGFEVNLLWQHNPGTDEDWLDHFQADYIQPVKVTNKAADNFVDAVDFGQEGSFITLKDLVAPKDWRGRVFGMNEGDQYYNYWDYYGIFKITVDIDQITCDLTPDKKVPVTILLETKSKEELKASLNVSEAMRDADGNIMKDEEGEVITIGDYIDSIDDGGYGFLTYRNNGTYVKEFKLFVPVTIQYGWGIITTDEPIEVLVETTIKDGE